MALSTNSIYLVLYYIRNSTPDKFHWGLVVKSYDSPVGELLHVYKQNDRWYYEHKQSTFEASTTSVLALKIGSISERTSWIQLNAIVAKVMLNWPLGFSCRTWVKDAVTELHNARVLRCPDVEALEQEARSLAAAYRPGRETSTGTWGVHASTVSL